MLQLKDPPYTVVELWWESEGKFRFAHGALGDDVMCAWPHGGWSNNSAWELEGLRQDLIDQRGLCAPLQLPARLGPWWLDRNASMMLLRNIHQPNNMMLLTRAGFVFFDKIGGALRVEGDSRPQPMSAREAALLVGFQPNATCPLPSEADCIKWPPTSQTPVLDKIYADFLEKYDAIFAAIEQAGGDGAWSRARVASVTRVRAAERGERGGGPSLGGQGESP
jgi:hypothetical protein